MPTHRNPSIVERASRILNTKANDVLSDEVLGPVATIELKPVCNIVIEGQRSTTGNNNVYTTPSDKDFYLTGFYFSWQTDAAADNTNITVFASINGVTKNLFRASKLTLTASSGSVYVPLAIPVKIDRGSVMGSSATFTVGACTHAVGFHGYTEEVKQ